MTSQKDQLQAVIREIDGVLNRPAPRLPWVNSDYTDQQRRVLEQTRDYLASLELSPVKAEATAPWAVQTAATLAPPPAPDYSPSESAQQVLLAVLQEMGYLRSSVMQPLRSDIEALQQKKEALAQEIRFLETQRQQYTPLQQQVNQQQIISDFLQSLMGRLQENLTGQVAQMLVNLEADTAHDRTLGAAPSPYPTVLSPNQRLEHLQMIQAQSDQLLLKLDSTLRVIFESLQTNLQSYQDSLSQGLDKMHGMGQQGEAMFAALVNRLAQQLGREASTYLQSSIGATGDAARSLPDIGISSSEEQINLLINQISQGEPLSFTQQPIAPPPAFLADLEGLNLLDLEVGMPLETNVAFVPNPDEELTFLQIDPSRPSILPAINEELTIFQLDETATPTQSDLDDLAVMPTLEQETDTDAGDEFDSSTLLDQLTATGQPGEPQIESTPDQVDTSDDEMDELYESLFGVTTDDSFIDPPIESSAADSLGSDSGVTTPSIDPETIRAEGDLFGGLSDPAEATTGDVAWDTAAQSLETFLFEGEAPLELATDDADDEIVSSGEWDAAPSEELDTIASLTDLISTTEADSNNLTELLQFESDQSLDVEDNYIAASPDETLLVSEELETERTEIRLPPSVLQQLTADLSNLEGLEQGEMVSSDLDLSAIEEEEWTLAWQEDPEPLVEPTVDRINLPAVADSLPQPLPEEEPDLTIPLEGSGGIYPPPQETPPQETTIELNDGESGVVEPDDPEAMVSSNLFEEFPLYSADSQATDDPFPETLLDFASPIEPDNASSINDLGFEPFDLTESATSDDLPDDLPAAEPPLLTSPDGTNDLAEPLSLDDFAVSAHTWSPSGVEDTDDATLDSLFEHSQEAAIEEVPNLFADSPAPSPSSLTPEAAFAFSQEELAVPLDDSATAAPTESAELTTELTLDDFNLTEPSPSESSPQQPADLSFALEAEPAMSDPTEFTLDRVTPTSDDPADQDDGLDELTLDRWVEADFEPSSDSIPAPEIDDLDALLMEPETPYAYPSGTESAAFTLEGLDSLFEDLPDLEPDVVPVPEPGALPSASLTLEDMFTDKQPLATPEAPLTTEEAANLTDAQKKTIRDRSNP